MEKKTTTILSLLVSLSTSIVSCHNERHEFVDMGLPSGTLWATCNVGASAPEEAGDYFAWGETNAKENYDYTTYKHCNGTYKTITKYNYNSEYGTVDDKDVLDLEDDAAYVNWGKRWRMPTYNEWKELCDSNYCTLRTINLRGVPGIKVTSVKNGNTLFFPFAGSRYRTGFWPSEGVGNYWSSTRDPRDHDGNISRCMGFQERVEKGLYGIGNRSDGYSVRPVRRQR